MLQSYTGVQGEKDSCTKIGMFPRGLQFQGDHGRLRPIDFAVDVGLAILCCFAVHGLFSLFAHSSILAVTSHIKGILNKEFFLATLSEPRRPGPTALTYHLYSSLDHSLCPESSASNLQFQYNCRPIHPQHPHAQRCREHDADFSSTQLRLSIQRCPSIRRPGSAFACSRPHRSSE